jgi:hypothetical protein
VIFFLSLGCGAEPVLPDPPPQAVDTAAPIEDPAWSWSEPEDDAAAWGADALEAAVARGMAWGFPGSVDFLARYFARMALGDEGCPGDAEIIDVLLHGHSGCTASTGYRYLGSAEYFDFADSAYGGWSLSADFQIFDPDGREFAGGGLMSGYYFSTGEWGESSYGTWYEEGSADWLGAPLSTAYEVELFNGEALLYGGIGIGDDVLFFDDVSFTAGCEGGAGALLVRSPDGAWLRVMLSCADCGPMDRDGVAAGEACPDLRPMGEDLLSL